MKRLLFSLILVCLSEFYIYADYIVATSESFSESELIEMFFEELDKEHYDHCVIDYEPATENLAPGEMLVTMSVGDSKNSFNLGSSNGRWSIRIGDEGYDYRGESWTNYGKIIHANERSIYLWIRNGYIAVRTFDNSTNIRNGLKSTTYINSGSVTKKLSSQFEDTVVKFFKESFKWMERKKIEEFSDSELDALDSLVGQFYGDNRTLLMLMAQQDISEAVMKICSRNGDAQDKDGWTALMYAASKNSLESAQLLLDAGVDCSIKNKKGQTALSIAYSKNYIDMTKDIEKAIKRQKKQKEVESYKFYYDNLIQEMKEGL